LIATVPTIDGNQPRSFRLLFYNMGFLGNGNHVCRVDERTGQIIIVSGNDAQDGSGGGIYSDVTGSSVVLSLVTMDGNDAGISGGGAYIGGSSLLLSGNNESANSGGGIYARQHRRGVPV
jgi:hypothetical protein